MSSCSIHFCKGLISQFTKLDISEQKQIEKEISDITNLLAKELEVKGNSSDAEIVKNVIHDMKLRNHFIPYNNIRGSGKKRKTKINYNNKRNKNRISKRNKNKRNMRGGMDLSIKILAISLTTALVASLSLGDISISGGLWTPIEGFLINKGLIPSLCSDYNIILGVREYVAPKFDYDSCSAIKMRYDIMFHSLRTILLTTGFYTLLSSRRHISDLYNYVLSVLGRLAGTRKLKYDEDDSSIKEESNQELTQENIESIAKEEEKVLTANLDEVETKAIDNAALTKDEVKEQVKANIKEDAQAEDSLVLTPKDVFQSSTSPEDIIPIPEEIASNIVEEALISDNIITDALLEAAGVLGGGKKHKKYSITQKKYKKRFTKKHKNNYFIIKNSNTYSYNRKYKYLNNI